MAWEPLPTNYTDAVWSGSKKYRMINNEDGTVSFEDVTVYSNRENSFFGAKEANRMNEALNTMMPTWGAGETFFCEEIPTGVDNTTKIGQAILEMLQKSSCAKLNIVGTIDLKYGAIIIPQLSSVPFGHLSIVLDFSRCNIICSTEPNLYVNLINFKSGSFGKVENLYINGLTLDQSIGNISLFYGYPLEFNSTSVFIVNSNFMLGRHSAKKEYLTLIVQDPGGTYPTYYFLNCSFKTNYQKANGTNFNTSYIIKCYNNVYPTFAFFENCKFLFFNSNKVDGTSLSEGGYGITNHWTKDKQIFRFNGCLMSTHILSAQSGFSNINTVTNLQKIFNNSEITNGNILFT